MPNILFSRGLFRNGPATGIAHIRASAILLWNGLAPAVFGPANKGASLLRRLLTCAVMFAPPALAADPVKLGAEDLKQTFTGSRVELDTPLGTTIPIQFTGDGLMSGNAGSLASVLGAANDRGRWWVKGDRLCYKWFRWFDAEEQCLTIHMKDERIIWHRDDGKKGTATLVERALVVAQSPKPSARPIAAGSGPGQVKIAAVPKDEVKAPVLKSPPRLAVRPKSAAERLDIPEEAPTDRSLFFVGLGMSQALQSQFGIARAEAAPAPKPPVPKPPVKAAAKKAPEPAKKTVVASLAPKAAPKPSSYPYPEPAGDEAAEAPPAAVSFSVYGVADDDVLNMRSGPSDEYAIVGVIPPNANAVRMVGRCVALWCEIQFRNTRGWVNRYYLAQN
jgi:Bacterial SH3 domain